MSTSFKNFIVIWSQVLLPLVLKVCLKGAMGQMNEEEKSETED